MKVIQTLYSGLGGHGNVVFSLIEADFGTTFENHLVFFGLEKMIPDYENRCSQLDIRFTQINKKRRQYLRPFNEFKKLLNDQKPGCIIIHGSELLLPALAYKKKTDEKVSVIYVEHEPNHTKGKVERFLTKRALKKADKVVVLSEVYQSQLEKEYNASIDKIEIIPNGVNSSTFNVAANKTTELKTFGMAARMTDTKDHSNLISAFEKLSKNNDYKLLLAGGGELEMKLKKKVQDLSIEDKITFLGLLDEAEMVAFFHQLDFYVHATHSETMSTSILQAMSCGLPILTSDIDNNKVLIKENVNGWLYNANEVIDLERQLAKAIEQVDKHPAICDANRKLIESMFSIDIMSNRYIQMIKNL